MSMLARYKKNEKSFMELVKLIEGSTPEKQTSLMKMVRQEDAAFAAKVEARVLTFDELIKCDEMIIAEVVSRSAPKVLAFLLLSVEDEEFIKTVEKSLGKLFAEVKSEKEALDGAEIPAAKKQAMERKFVSEARKASDEGVIRLPVREVDESSGASLESASALSEATSAEASSEDPSSEMSYDPSKVPPVAAFGLKDVPPPGLSGERFEEFVKRKLGI